MLQSHARRDYLKPEYDHLKDEWCDGMSKRPCVIEEESCIAMKVLVGDALGYSDKVDVIVNVANGARDMTNAGGKGGCITNLGTSLKSR